MAITRIESGQLVCQAGDALKELYVIGEGNVRAAFPGGGLMMRKGDIIGIQDIKSGVHSCTYIAATDVALVPYPYNGLEQLLALFQTKPNVMHLFFTSSARFSSSLLKYCAQIDRREPGEYVLDSKHASTVFDKAAYIQSQAAAAGKAGDSPEAMADPSGSTDNGIPYDRVIPPAKVDPVARKSPAAKPADTQKDDEEAKAAAQKAAAALGTSEIPPELEDSLSIILSFSECDEELARRFSEEVAAYKAMPDKDGTEDADRRFRLSLTSDFYKLYTKVFEMSINETNMPAPVKLFLNFGYVDAELAGVGNSAYLLSILDTFGGDAENGVYTFYEWLMAVYRGDKEPSRNEFDMDYPAYLRDQKKSGKINEMQEKQLLDSNVDKVRFELENVFPVVNKMTFGRISTFCPLLSAHNLLKPLNTSLVTPPQLLQAINAIRELDFSAFYRETTYTSEEYGIVREYLQVEILPDFILMPNIGTRGVMWQEIEGKRRLTPSRMMLSVIALENISQLLTRMTGEFRWEMCKRVQGARWNDVSEPSLTSQYTDYIQFYKKNRELSPDAKEKLRLSLQRAKNSVKEMFVRDYMIWISYEGKGSPRLNKVARPILFTYCPFALATRQNLVQHPLYMELINRYKLLLNQKLHHLDMLKNKLEKNYGTIPEEITNQIEFLKS